MDMSVTYSGETVSRQEQAQDIFDESWRAERQSVSELTYAELYRQERANRIAVQEASKAKDLSFAIVAHELRQPLSAIFLWAQWAGDPLLDDRDRHEALREIESSARMRARLIEDLLDMARILNGKLRVDMRPVELGGVIATAVDLARPAAKLKDVALIATKNGDTVTVCGDEVRLRQVMGNLLGNALKFTPSGGTVRVDMQRSESCVRTRVTDNGRGIKPEFLPRVFDWFQQEGPDTREGLGLGLPLVRKIVELHGGRVRADSEGPGRGAAFTVTLPTAGAITESHGWLAAE